LLLPRRSGAFSSLFCPQKSACREAFPTPARPSSPWPGPTSPATAAASICWRCPSAPSSCPTSPCTPRTSAASSSETSSSSRCWWHWSRLVSAGFGANAAVPVAPTGRSPRLRRSEAAYLLGVISPLFTTWCKSWVRLCLALPADTGCKWIAGAVTAGDTRTGAALSHPPSVPAPPASLAERRRGKKSPRDARGGSSLPTNTRSDRTRSRSMMRSVCCFLAGELTRWLCVSLQRSRPASAGFAFQRAVFLLNSCWVICGWRLAGEWMGPLCWQGKRCRDSLRGVGAGGHPARPREPAHLCLAAVAPGKPFLWPQRAFSRVKFQPSPAHVHL